MVSQGITDYELYADAKSDRIIVRFPWKEDSDQNAIEAIEEISSTAQLTFRPGKEYSTTDVDSNGEYVYKTPWATQLRQSLWTVLMLKVQQQV